MAKPFFADAGTYTTAGEIPYFSTLAEVKGRTVTLLRGILTAVPEITKAGRVLRISVPIEGSNLRIQMLPSR